eukprot:4539039-Pyramimonas_sp.AAC.1
MTPWRHCFLCADWGRGGPRMVQDPRSPMQAHQQSQLTTGESRGMSRFQQLSVTNVFKRLVKVQEGRSNKKLTPLGPFGEGSLDPGEPIRPPPTSRPPKLAKVSLLPTPDERAAKPPLHSRGDMHERNGAQASRALQHEDYIRPQLWPLEAALNGEHELPEALGTFIWQLQQLSRRDLIVASSAGSLETTKARLQTLQVEAWQSGPHVCRPEERVAQ